MAALTVNVWDKLPRFVREPDPNIYLTGSPLFLDFETTNLDKGDARNKQNRIVLSCWQEGWDGPLVHKWGGEYELDDLCDAVTRADFLVAHNAKFELKWLQRCGVSIDNLLVYDTMLAEYVIGGNRWKTSQLSLQMCAERRGLGSKGKIVSAMMKAGVPTEDIPTQWLLKYCEQDLRLSLSLMKRQLQEVEGTRLLPVIYSRALLCATLADLEQNGMRLSEDLISMTSSLESQLRELESRGNRLAQGVNLGSPKQMGAYLYDQLKFSEPTIRRGRKVLPDRTASGQRKTDSDTIAELECRTEEQRVFKALYMEAKEVGQQLSKYLRKFVECLTDAGGVLYANFNQMQTSTQRLSSSGAEYKVQFQNFPRAYKKFFRAKRDGWLIGECDGAQIEFRVAGHLGKDPQVKADVKGKVDVHAFTAETLTGAGQETDRQGAKEHTFKPLYGGSSGTEAEQTYYRAFKDRYKGVADAQARWIDRVLANKKLETEWGLVYYWPDTRMDSTGYITNTTSICNYPVQALATAEIIPLALVCMWHRLKRMPELRMELVNTVHDSIVAEFPPEEERAFHDLARTCMIYDAEYMVKRLYDIDLYVPLGCGVKVGDRWGTGTETKYEKESE